MASKGRPRKPITVKILEGTFRADRDTAHLLGLPVGEPKPPAHLAGVPLDLWQQIIPGLISRGFVSACDDTALSLMVEWLAKYRRYSDAADSMPIDDKGLYQMTLLAGIAATNFDRFASRFGLTPADRSRLKVDPATAPRKVAARKRS